MLDDTIDVSAVSARVRHRVGPLRLGTVLWDGTGQSDSMVAVGAAAGGAITWIEYGKLC